MRKSLQNGSLQISRRAVAGGYTPAVAVATNATAAVSASELVYNWQHLGAEIGGIGMELATILQQNATTDVLVNGAGEIWADRGDGMVRCQANLGGEKELRALAVRMAAACGRRLDDAEPIVDGTLPDGTRLHAVLPPISAEGTLISLRTKRKYAFTLNELAKVGTVNPKCVPLLEAIVRTRASAIISGATGSGKTTLLATLLGLIPADERIICIEEVSELTPNHPHVVHLQERRPNVQKVGAVPLPELVKAAMRMRPDRIVLGECRGAEVREVLTALNTGHEGGMATIHANTATDVPARLVALGALAGMSSQTVCLQAAPAFDVVLHLVKSGGRRQLKQIALPELEGERLVCRLALELGIDGQMVPGPGWEKLCHRLELGTDLAKVGKL